MTRSEANKKASLSRQRNMLQYAEANKDDQCVVILNGCISNEADNGMFSIQVSDLTEIQKDWLWGNGYSFYQVTRWRFPFLEKYWRITWS